MSAFDPHGTTAGVAFQRCVTGVLCNPQAKGFWEIRYIVTLPQL